MEGPIRSRKRRTRTPSTSSFTAGLKVRIHLPPAGSHRRTAPLWGNALTTLPTGALLNRYAQRLANEADEGQLRPAASTARPMLLPGPSAREALVLVSGSVHSTAPTRPHHRARASPALDRPSRPPRRLARTAGSAASLAFSEWSPDAAAAAPDSALRYPECHA